jgi:hypothetical protein
MKRRKTIGWMLGILFFIVGCKSGPAPSQTNWVAQPTKAEKETPFFKIAIEPQKGNNPYFSSFLLTVENKTDADLSIDWNRCRYLFNGKPKGLFVFEGIDPASIQTATVPSEVIPPDVVYTKEIMPHRLIAWSPIKEKTQEDRSILPGMFPEGENGAQLVIQNGEKLVAGALSVRIMKERLKE